MSEKNYKLFRKYLRWLKTNPKLAPGGEMVKMRDMVKLWGSLSDKQRHEWRKKMKRRDKMEETKRVMAREYDE